MDSIAAARIHISCLVTLDTIGHAAATVRKQLPSRKLCATIYDIILVDRAGEARIEREVASIARRAVRLYRTSVGDVHLLVIGTEAEAIALHEAVCNTPNLSRRRFEAVDLAWQLR